MSHDFGRPRCFGDEAWARLISSGDDPRDAVRARRELISHSANVLAGNSQIRAEGFHPNLRCEAPCIHQWRPASLSEPETVKQRSFQSPFRRYLLFFNILYLYETMKQ